MDNSTIIMNLQCFIALAQFDPLTGKTALHTDAETEREITACEESIKFLNGVPEDVLLLSKEDIIAALTRIRDSLEEHISNLKGMDEEVIQNSMIKLECDQMEAFGSMVTILGEKQKKETP